MNMEIQTYWNVETLYYVLNAIASVMTSGGWSGLIKFVFIIALLIAMFAYMGRHGDMAMWFIQAFAFVTILNMPIARVMLSDRTDLQPPRQVDHVPVALAAIAQASTLSFGFLTRAYETAFNVPDDLGNRQGGCGFRAPDPAAGELCRRPRSRAARRLDAVLQGMYEVRHP